MFPLPKAPGRKAEMERKSIRVLQMEKSKNKNYSREFQKDIQNGGGTNIF